MEPASPPKRMTRARAAAKATSTDSTSTTASSRAKSTTASSRARTSTATATTASAAAKRKLRTEDVETDNEQDELGLDRPQPPTMQKVVRAARGRPKKVVEAEPETAVAPAAAPAPRPRGRPPTKKAPVPEAARPTSRASTTTTTTTTTVPTAAPARATRTKKTVTLADDASEEPAKKRATRARATSATVSSAAASAATTTRISVRSASATVAKSTTTGIKKKVTFEEPEKENIVPAIGTTKGSKLPAPKAAAAETTTATTSGGLKAKPVRRAAATTAKTAATTTSTARSRTASGKAATDKPAGPLSPKKVTQVRLARDFDVDSEDELGASDESHLKPFERSPTKPFIAAGITPAERNKALANAGLDLESASRDIAANNASTTTLAPPDLQAGLLKSPARRPPPTPAKEGLMNSPARRLDGLMEGVLASSKKTSNNNGSSDSNGNSKSHSSVLFSPAKRFPVHPKNQTGGQDGDTLRSPMKLSLLQTPAKRPASPVKAAILLQRPDMKPSTLSAKADIIASSPEPKSTLVANQPSMREIQEEAEGVETEEEMHDGEDEADEADVSDAESDAEHGGNDKTESLTQMLNDMAADAAEAMPDSPSRRRFPGRLSAVLPRNADPTLEVQWDDVQSDAEVVVEVEAEIEAKVEAEAEEDGENDLPAGEPMDVDESILGAATALVAMSPPKPKTAPSGVFGLRAKDLDACDDDDMDSDNDVTTRIAFSSNDDMPATPCPASKTPSGRSARASMGGQSTAKRPKMGKFGFTPLADQLNGWKVRSPVKTATPTPAENVEETVEEPTEVAEEIIDEDKTSLNVSDVSVLQSYFDDAMAGHSVLASPRQSEITVPSDDKECADLMENVVLQEEIETPEFDEDLVVTEEDLGLAQEANEMSLMEPSQLEEIIHHTPRQSSSQDDADAMSEASQEYDDENAIPIDPALLAEGVLVPPVTPQRVLTRTFHTVSKVPLKPADDSTPPQRPAFRRRSMSASRLPTSSRRRSSISAASSGKNAAATTSGTASGNSSPSKGLTRSATVISYSPSKKDGRRESRRDSRRRSRRESFGGPALTLEDALFDSSEDESPDVLYQPEPATTAPVTPIKSSAEAFAEATWSTAGTPARTPRRDVDPALLSGAVVFVDVHTTEGADASAIFVELLTQMGAQCVKTWPWNPSSGGDNCRVGITHVVFKDGSKHTLDKVRESNGLVQCVGVSWVLDCERSNQWQDEEPYVIDTALVPRGGARRRKSMEPEALANINGLLVSTPPKQTGGPSAAVRECRTAPQPSTPMNRRDSTLWMRTPDDEEEERNDQENADADGYGEPDWGMSTMLTPVPKTPAPEAVARYAANITPSSPYGDEASSYYGDGDGDSTLASQQFDQGPLVTRTCPPKQRSVSYRELGAGILSREKDEGVLMRLMAARRKSLQFAPKIASPLSKAWN
ncbi:hypothetical protein Sste5346_009706 [Sporothrix stenoceras]|uniref:BRCT domain-containing protein n=1 Tax=Sporothrix stenoceras TaxID=5173 RepID=A0ABR3YK41_9PEZI